MATRFAQRSSAPLVVIVGPTASGKSALAIEVAKQLGGEIICADSRTIYKGMDIGTAKPSQDEQRVVPHWGLDLIEPGERFTAADFKQYAISKIKEIRARGHMPLLVGGSGLYVDSVLFDYQFGSDPDVRLRSELEGWSVEKLQSYCKENNINLPENSRNKRYLIRAIEQKSINTKRQNKPIENSKVVGISTNKEQLLARIRRRTEQLFDNSVVEEATLLGKKYGWKSEAMTGNIYQVLRLYINEEVTLDEAKEKTIILDWQLAKRQLTWFKRNPYIEWLDLSEAKNRLLSVLANEHKA